MKSGGEIIERLRKKVAMLRLAEGIFWSLALACIGAVLAVPFTHGEILPALIGTVTAVLGFISMRRLLNYQPSREQIAKFLDYKFPELENSTDLLLTDTNALNELERFQRRKTATILEQVYNGVRINHRIPLAVLVCAAAVLLLVLATSPKIEKDSFVSSKQYDRDVSPSIPGTETAKVNVVPPLYTGLKPYDVAALAVSVPEGSKIKWTISFTETISSAYIILGNSDSVKLIDTGRVHEASIVSTRPTFYQLTWRKDTIESVSDFFKLDVRPDASPEITVRDVSQFTELAYDDKLTVPISADFSDDYGLTEGYVIATVSKGSGESVKFREEKLLFEKPSAIRGTQVTAFRQLDLKALGLDPGDELYFYIMAFDNRSPQRNYTRSQTYFLALKDTAEIELSFDAGLGVDLMPEYFRSQRQIIIDTEKLLKQQKKISVNEFKSKSNELAHDQKVLRLRYGQFLGEEFESGMVQEEEHGEEPDHHDHADGTDDHDAIVKEFGHAHDNEQSGERDISVQHDHGDKDPEEVEDPLERFVHRHDDPEEATFFTQSIRAKLKATLTLMWDAELHLRLGTPDKSLPFQYKALKLLKEISNDSRIYVHRTGFDAPPVKEEKRLSGELVDVRGSTDVYSAETNVFPLLHQALAIAEELARAQNVPLSEAEREVFHNAGVEAGRLARENPLKYIPLLSALQKFTTVTPDAGNRVERALNLSREIRKVLPQRPPAASARKTTVHPIDSLFIQNLFSRE